MVDYKDPFKDLTFDGRPRLYREFRRKVILSVAALEDENQHLAGPKLLSRLTGEIWRCTEHLSIAQVRSKEGWLKVLEWLDRHYKHLPEVELHESIDDFLFHLKKKPHECTTAFSARFKTALARLETLIQSEREAASSKRRKRGDEHRPLAPATPVDSSLDESSPGSPHEADQTDDADLGEQAAESAQPEQSSEAELAQPSEAAPKAAAKSGAAPKSGATPTPSERGPSRGPSEFGSARSSHHKSGKSHKTQKSTGTAKGDHDRDQRAMQRMLGTLEPSHRKPKPIFPQSFLGHLFMRNFGLNREQRALVIRSTGGSSRFLDAERILRASSPEDPRGQDRRLPKPQLKPGRRDAFAVDVEDSSSLELPLSESDGDDNGVLVGEEVQEPSESDDDELAVAEIYEIHRKSQERFQEKFQNLQENPRRR